MPQNVKLISTLSAFAGNETPYVRYQNPPDSEAYWFLPNDVLHDQEDPYEGARRVAKEQLGLDVKALELFDVDSFVGNDNSWHLALHFRTDIPDKSGVTRGQGVTDLSWHHVGNLRPQTEIAHKGWYNGIMQRAHRHRQRTSTPSPGTP